MSRASLFERDDDSQIFDAIVKSETDTIGVCANREEDQKISLGIAISRYRGFRSDTLFLPLLTHLVTSSFLSRLFILVTFLLIGDREEIEQNHSG